MGNLDIGHTDFKVYEGSTEFLGMSEVSLPDLEYMTETVTGAGVAGEFEESYRGYAKAMSVGLNFRSVTAAAIVLAEPRTHTLELRAAVQEYNTVSGEIEIKNIKHVMKVVPKKTSAGKLAAASPADASGEYGVRYWKMVKDGEVLLEIDSINFIFIVNKNDYLYDVQKALNG